MALKERKREGRAQEESLKEQRDSAGRREARQEGGIARRRADNRRAVVDLAVTLAAVSDDSEMRRETHQGR